MKPLHVHLKPMKSEGKGNNIKVCDFITGMIKENPGNWMVCGDFNMVQTEMDLARPKQNYNNNMFTLDERERMAGIAKAGMVDVFRYMYPERSQYTWWSYSYNARERNVGWRLDYIFLSEALKGNIKRIDILKDELGSDHCPVLVEMEM